MGKKGRQSGNKSGKATNGPSASVVMEAYADARSLYEEFGRTVGELLARLLTGEGIHIHSITWRTKDPDSLRRKLALNPRKYVKLDDVTDLAGVRVITYFPDEVDQVASIVRREFKVDSRDRPHSLHQGR